VAAGRLHSITYSVHVLVAGTCHGAGSREKERRACLLSQAARRESERKIERTHNSLANFKHYLPVTGAKNWPLEREREECGVYVCARRENARGLKILLRRRIFSKAVAKCC